MSIIKSAKREQENGIKGVIYGESGVGKTTLIHTLPPEKTLVLDLEAGLLAIEGWDGDSVAIRQWEYARAWASLIGGVNPAVLDATPYGQQYYNNVVAKLGIDPKDLDKYENIFIDSITVASRLCLDWAKRQPEAFTKQNEISNLKVYGLLGQEMIHWLTQLQHTKGKNVWFVGILDKKTDDIGATVYEPQMEGSKGKLELPGIVDQVITMTVLKSRDKDGVETKRRVFVTDKLNKWGYPAKDRSGRLDAIEVPHLGKLMNKIKHGERKALNFDEVLSGDEILY
jgi:hypothetical protein